MIVRRKTQAEKKAEDKWWLSLPQEQRKDHLDRRRKERKEREATKAILGTIAIVAYIIFAGITAVILLMRYW